MSIWNVSLKAADLGNVLGYAALFVGAILAGSTYVLEPNIAPAAGLASASAVVVGTFLIFWASAVRDRYADLAIADLRLSAERTRLELAKSEEKSWQLMEEVQNQKIRHAQLLRNVASREIDSDRKERITRRLQDIDTDGATIELISTYEGDSINLALSIADAVCGFGIESELKTVQTINHGLFFGVRLLVGTGKSGQEIAEAIADQDIDYVIASATPGPGEGRIIPQVYNPSKSISILIGPRPPFRPTLHAQESK